MKNKKNHSPIFQKPKFIDGIDVKNNRVDIGVRVETNNIIMDDINKYLYEGKFIFNTSVGTIVRTFCSNPSGHVVVENHSGTMLANGKVTLHTYPHVILFPAIFISLLMITFNLFGNGLRDALNPSLKGSE